MAQINIKPKRLVLIAALQKAIDRMERENKDVQVANKQYADDLEAWQASADLSPENIKSSYIKMNTRADTVEGVFVTLKKYPKGMPKRPQELAISGWKRTEALEDMRATINMLKLSDEEVVNASVANKVAKYL